MRKSLYKPISIIRELKSVEIDRPISNTEQCLYLSMRNEKYLMGIDLDSEGMHLALYIYKKDAYTGIYHRILDIVPEETNDNDLKIRVIDDIHDLEHKKSISVGCTGKNNKCCGTALDIYLY